MLLYNFVITVDKIYKNSDNYFTLISNIPELLLKCNGGGFNNEKNYMGKDNSCGFGGGDDIYIIGNGFFRLCGG